LTESVELHDTPFGVSEQRRHGTTALIKEVGAQGNRIPRGAPQSGQSGLQPTRLVGGGSRLADRRLPGGRECGEPNSELATEESADCRYEAVVLLDLRPVTALADAVQACVWDALEK
jgi:hypothetical protein